MRRVMRALLLLALANGCGNSNSGGQHDMAAPDDLSMAADQSMDNPSTDDLAMPDLASPTTMTGADMTVPPDLGPMVVPHWSADGPVNAVVHAGTAWYLGGSFSRLSPYPMPQLIAIDAGGTPTGCPIDTGFDGNVNAVVAAGGAIYAGGAFTHYQGASAKRLAKIDAATCALDTTFSPAANNGFDNDVLSLAVAGTSLFVGGSYQHYRGATANRIVKLALSDGAPDATFAGTGTTGFDNNVYALAVAGTALYAGGSFGSYRGSVALHLAKVDQTDGTLDTTFSPQSGGNGFDNTVLALAASPASLYVGGFFFAYRGVADSAHRIAKLALTDGAQDTTFSPQASATSNGFDDVVEALAVDGTSVYAGGQFVQYRGASTANHLAKLAQADGTLDTTFSPQSGGNGFSGEVRALAVSGTTLFAGGSFGAYRGTSGAAYAIAKLDLASGNADASFVPTGSNRGGFSGATPQINAIAVSGSTLWVGGRASVYGGFSANNLAKLDDTSFAVDTTFSPSAANGFNAPVLALAPLGTSLYVGGSFTAYRGVGNSALRLAKLAEADGTLDTTFSPNGATANGFDNSVNALATIGSFVYVGGAFDKYRNVTDSAHKLAKLDADSGTLDTTFSPAGPTANGFDAPVDALAVSLFGLYVGGDFTAYRGVANSANKLAKLDVATGAQDTTFSPGGATANGFDSTVRALAVTNSSLYAGGDFTAYRGVANSANRLARLDRTTGALDTTFSPGGATANGFDNSVRALDTAGGTALYVGGDFTAYQGVAGSANRLAKLNPSSGALDTTFSPAAGNGVDATVDGVGFAGTTLLAVGAFNVVRSGPTLTRGIAILDATSGAHR